jgi:hypothetical protein
MYDRLGSATYYGSASICRHMLPKEGGGDPSLSGESLSILGGAAIAVEFDVRLRSADPMAF